MTYPVGNLRPLGLNTRILQIGPVSTNRDLVHPDERSDGGPSTVTEPGVIVLSLSLTNKNIQIIFIDTPFFIHFPKMRVFSDSQTL